MNNEYFCPLCFTNHNVFDDDYFYKYLFFQPYNISKNFKFDQKITSKSPKNKNNQKAKQNIQNKEEETNNKEVFEDFINNLLETDTSELTEEEIKDILNLKPQKICGWKRVKKEDTWFLEKVPKPLTKNQKLKWDYNNEDWITNNTKIYQTFK